MPHFAVASTRDFDAAVQRAGNAALGLWTRAGAWSVARLTDGQVPREVALMLGTEPQARRLVASGLWAETADGFAFTTWESDGNRTRIEVESVAVSRRKAGRLGGVASGKSRQRTPDSGSDTPPDQGVPEASASSKTNPLPYPPLPSPSLQTPSVSDARDHAAVVGAAMDAWLDASAAPASKRGKADFQREAIELLTAERHPASPAELIEAARRTGQGGYGAGGLAVALRSMRAAGRPRAAEEPRRLSKIEERIARTQSMKTRAAGRGDVIDAEVVELRAVGGEHR